MAKDGQSGTTYGELCVEPQLLDNPRIFAGSEAAVVLRLGTSHNHLSTRKDQSSRLGLANTHDDSGETLRVVLSVATMFWRVGTIPDDVVPFWVSGVAAGVATPFALLASCCAFFSEDGGVRSPWLPGNEREPGATN
jgi:hypothetical protein